MSRHKTLVGTEIVLILGLVGFVAAMVGLEHTAPGPARLGPIAALAFAAVPSVLWLGYFYLQDRNEPEPKQLVFGMFVLGAFVASPLASFVASALPVGAADLDPLSAHRVLTNVLVVGMAQEMSKYAVVRYSIYHHAEFDEPMDGIIYMMAAGIGFAAAQNYRHLESLGGNVVLSQAAMTTVVNTLAHACFAGVLGYALGQAKFSKAPPDPHQPERAALRRVVSRGATQGTVWRRTISSMR